MQSWPIQDAKSRFSELIDKAITQGAQQITRHGKNVAVILANEDYEKITSTQGDFVQMLLNAPRGEALQIERSQEAIRELEL